MTPIVAIDHLRISVADLALASEQYELLLGTTVDWRGNVDGAPAAALAAGNLHVVLRAGDSAPGLDRVCFRIADRARFERGAQRVGVAPLAHAEDPLAALSDKAPGGGLLVADSGSTRGVEYAFVERGAPVPMAPTAVSGLDHVVVNSADGDRTGYLLGAQLGLDLRMDLSNPDWGARLLFFRCGDLIVEVAARTQSDATADSLYGLSWRVADAAVARERLAAAGLDVSGVRAGRKPGTRVFTVRDGTAGVPTLAIEPPH